MSSGPTVLEERPPDAVAPPPGNPRFPLFDGLRAFAAISILVAHAAFQSGFLTASTFAPWAANLNVGVAVFFVISGFLLYRPFVAAHLDGRDPPHTLRFYRRRILRIVPAYWVALTLLSIYPLDSAMFDEWPKYFFFLQIYSPSFYGLGQAWSLCVEMSFYLVLPFYAFAMQRWQRGAAAGRRLRVELTLLAGLSVLSLVPHWLVANGHVRYGFAGLPQFMFWFALGMGLALVSAHYRDATTGPIAWVARRPGWCWAAAGAAFVLLGALTTVPPDALQYSPGQFMLQYVGDGIVAFALVLPAVVMRPTVGVPRRVLAHRWVAWLGLVSYGIFLWQSGPLDVTFNRNWVHATYVPVRFLLYAGIALAITIPLAALSYYVVERPFLRLKDRRARQIDPVSEPTTRSTR